MEDERKKAEGGLAQGVANAKGAIANVAGVTKGKAVDVANAAGSKIALGAAGAKKGVSRVVRETKERWYNPVFLEEYQSADFDMPKLVVIVDEDTRKGNELCEGAIGWLNTRHVPEIMFMYEEFAPNCGLRFGPRATCGGVYYRHPLETDMYLLVKDYLKICKRDQLTELKHIAFMLGAVHCSVEVREEKSIVGRAKSLGKVGAREQVGKERAAVNASAEASADFFSKATLNVVMNESFEPGAIPQRPELKWFANDNEILSLVEKRCGRNVGGVMNSYVIDITSAMSSSISADFAKSIDASLKSAKVSAGASLSAGLKKEEKKRLLFKVEF